MDDRSLVQKIIAAKMQVLDISTFFGILLQHVIFAVDSQCPTACTDAERIYFGTHFCDDLDCDEMTLVLLHEMMHIVLGHCFRGVDKNPHLYNIAADIVINSTLAHTMGLDLSVKGETLMHIAPNGAEGYLYTAEEVYEMLLDKYPPPSEKNPQGGEGEGDGDGGSADGTDRTDESADDRGEDDDFWAQIAEVCGGIQIDDHSRWGSCSEAVEAEWQGRIADACKTAIDTGRAAGRDAAMVDRFYKQLTQPTIDWRLLLQNFIQTDVVDYSFMPPDRRYDTVFLPDFSLPEDKVCNLWLVMDTSGSVSDKDMARAFSEIKGGIEQFDGALEGKLSFFDCAITEPVPFSTVEDLALIRPKGGGGTSFHVVFDYFRKHLYEKEEITGIIIFTDGYAVFPPQSMALDTPVFWLINNALVTPPWGVVARYLPETKR